MPRHWIPNEQLVLDRIPDPEANLWVWERFAHTINGYEVVGGFEACADLANRGTPTTLTQLRCCLFFEARRERHSGELSTKEEWIRELLRAIRQKVERASWIELSGLNPFLGSHQHPWVSAVA